MSIKVVDTSWIAIDEGEFLPPPKYRRFIRVAVLEYYPPLALPRRFWAFIDRLTASFYIEEEASHSLKVVEPVELHHELWEKCKEQGLLDVIIPWEDPPMIYADRETSLDIARKEYLRTHGYQVSSNIK